MQDDMQKYASNNIAEKEDFVLNFVKTRVLTPMMNLLSNQLRRKTIFLNKLGRQGKGKI